MSNFAQTFSERVAEVLQDNLKSTPVGPNIKAWEPGDVMSIALPGVLIEKQSTMYRAKPPTGMDVRFHTLAVRVVWDRRKGLKSTNSGRIGGSRLDLERLVEGVDPTTNALSASSIIGILRANFTLRNVAVDQQEDVRYGSTRSPDQTDIEQAIVTVRIEDMLSSTKS